MWYVFSSDFKWKLLDEKLGLNQGPDKIVCMKSEWARLGWIPLCSPRSWVSGTERAHLPRLKPHCAGAGVC